MAEKKQKESSDTKNKKNSLLIALFGILALILVGIVGAVLFILITRGNRIDPVEFNNKIVNEQNAIITEVIDFSKTFQEAKSKEEALVKHNKALTQAKTSLENLKAIQAPSDGAAMKSKAEELFSFYVDIIDNEYEELIGLVFSDKLTEAQQKRIFDIIKDVTDRENKIDAEFKTVQEEFAKNNNFDLQNNELQDDIDDLKN